MKPVPEKWRALFALIPGYDPIATAGDCEFDAATAERCVSFFSTYIRHVEGELAGKPLMLEPWQQAIVGCAFGWFRPDGRRRYREVFQYIPRKNGKTCLLGGLINLVAFCDDEPGAQIYSAAADREQAALVYRQAKQMCVLHPELSSQVKIYASFKSIEYPNGNMFKALSADADNKHGFNSHFVVVDELHAQPNRDLVDVLVTSTGSRRNPLVWYITTADFARDSICNEKLEYARKIRDGVVSDPAFLPIIYEASIDDDWKSEATWRKANPNLGVSISVDWMRRECVRAQEIPAYENTFKRLHLNIQTQQDVRWLPMELWDTCGAPFDPATLAGRTCYAAMDLSTKHDITAVVKVFPPTADDPLWRVLPRFYVPGDRAEDRERKDRVPYLTWGRQGFITLTDGNVVDYERVKADILADAKTYELTEIGFDPWNATQIALQLGESGATCVEMRQGFQTLSEPSKELEKLLLSRKIAHSGHPVLRWMASNVAIEIDANGNIRPSKKKSTERIDGIAALVMALGRGIVSTTAECAYDTRGVLSI